MYQLWGIRVTVYVSVCYIKDLKVGLQWLPAESGIAECKGAICALETWRIQLKAKDLELPEKSVSEDCRACTGRLKGLCAGRLKNWR